MKGWYLIVVLFLFSGTQQALKSQNCAVSIPSSQSIFDGQNLNPGDTVCIQAGLKAYLLIKNCYGSASSPIVFINHGGAVVIDTDHFYGIKIASSSHVKLLGNGVENQTYGIRINRVGNGAGISIDEMSTNVEIAWIEVSNTAIGGIYAKTDPDCSFNATRDKFTMHELHIHHNYLHDIADEGLYIGSSKYTGQYLSACDTTVLPHYIHGVHVHDNVLERIGWDGIQVSSSPVDCRIYNNTIIEDSYAETPNQMSGILIGGGSVCDCYNNIITNGKGDGIDVFGHQTMKIYNNLIIKAGTEYMPDDPNAMRHGIFVGNSPAGEATRLHIMHNTIISPKTTGIRFFNSNSSNNLIFNNIITNPGAYGSMQEQAYFNATPPLSLFSIRNNLFTENINEVKFINHLSENFDLQASSPAVNTGFNAGLNAVLFDLMNRPRPHNQGFDIGAFESQDPFALIPSANEWPFAVEILSNPVTDELLFRIDNPTHQTIVYDLLDAGGRTLNDRTALEAEANEPQMVRLNMNMLRPGLYFLRFEQNRRFYTRPVIKFQ